MRAILQKRGLRYIFAANMISMLGSGMNAATVAWYILQATHSKMALGLFAVLQTLPAMLMLPFTGVLIDREDRRRLVMWLDAGHRHPHRCRVRFNQQSEALGSLFNEHAGGGRFLDVLADDHGTYSRADPG